MIKCVACKKYVSPKGDATCATCRGIFHRGCVGVPETLAFPRDWVCPDCDAKQAKTSDDSGTPLKYPGQAQALLAAAKPANAANLLDSEFIASLRRDLDGYMAKQREFRAEQREFRIEIQATLQSMTSRMEKFERRLDAVERQESSGGMVEELQHTVAHLQAELSDRDQDALLSDLDIGHIPEVKGENVVHTVTVLAAKLGVDLDPRDVVFAERVGAVERGGTGAAVGNGVVPSRPRRIVVRLARRQLRDNMLQAARVRRNVTSADAGLPGPAGRVYVNERLTRVNRQLFQRVREECRKKLWRFAWTKRGRVYARQADGKQAYSIRSDANVARVFGLATV